MSGKWRRQIRSNSRRDDAEWNVLSCDAEIHKTHPTMWPHMDNAECIVRSVTICSDLFEVEYRASQFILCMLCACCMIKQTYILNDEEEQWPHVRSLAIEQRFMPITIIGFLRKQFFGSRQLKVAEMSGRASHPIPPKQKVKPQGNAAQRRSGRRPKLVQKKSQFSLLETNGRADGNHKNSFPWMRRVLKTKREALVRERVGGWRNNFLEVWRGRVSP